MLRIPIFISLDINKYISQNLYTRVCPKVCGLSW